MTPALSHALACLRATGLPGAATAALTIEDDVSRGYSPRDALTIAVHRLTEWAGVPQTPPVSDVAWRAVQACAAAALEVSS
jgi:hypothetical protein